MIQVHSDIYSWRDPKFIQHLHIFGLSLLAMSALYLVAANWLMIPPAVQLAIPQVLLVLSAFASLWVKHEVLVTCLHTVCGLMLGLSLAVIGQVYQTGADSYLLFLIWSVLLLPWSYRLNIGVFSLLCFVSQIALFLFFTQTFWGERSPLLFLTCVNLFALIQFYFCIRYYPPLRFFFYFGLAYSLYGVWLCTYI